MRKMDVSLWKKSPIGKDPGSYALSVGCVWVFGFTCGEIPPQYVIAGIREAAYGKGPPSDD